MGVFERLLRTHRPLTSMFGRRLLCLWGLFVGSYSALAYAAYARWRGRGRPARCGFAVKVGSGEALHRHALCMPMHLPYSTSRRDPKCFRGTVVAAVTSLMAMSMTPDTSIPESARDPAGKTDARRRFMGGPDYALDTTEFVTVPVDGVLWLDDEVPRRGGSPGHMVTPD